MHFLCFSLVKKRTVRINSYVHRRDAGDAECNRRPYWMSPFQNSRTLRTRIIPPIPAFLGTTNNGKMWEKIISKKKNAEKHNFCDTVKVEMFAGWIFSRVKTSRTHIFAEKNSDEKRPESKKLFKFYCFFAMFLVPSFLFCAYLVFRR